MKNKEKQPDAIPLRRSARLCQNSGGQGIRRQAEKKAREKAALSPEYLQALSPEEIQQTLHELHVHQIELEMQNENLRRAHMELDALRVRYLDLYDLAPVGYCTISEKGLFLEVNFACAMLLGVARAAIVKQPIARFILKEDQDIYYLLLKQCLKTGETQPCELRMMKTDGAVYWVQLTTAFAQDSGCAPVYRVVLSDITDRKTAEEKQRRNTAELESRNEELAQINRLAIGRELRMIELKKEVNALCAAAGLPPRYDLDFENDKDDR
jgi:PAS domain S-box-containing protein